VYGEKARMYTVDNPGKFRIQWHRFTYNLPLPPLLKTSPHVALKANNLARANEGEEAIPGPYEPIDGYFMTVINDNGVPVEPILTTLSGNELWGPARDGQGSLYR
jgi:hypothetical protein